MAVKDWIMGFLDRHQARFAPHDWPADGATEEWREFTKGWITALALRQVTEAEADDASSRLAARPPAWRREHIPAILEAIEAIRQERSGPAPQAMTRERVEHESKAAAHCGGGGLTSVWHPRPDPIAKVPETLAAYCICPMGRWIERIHRDHFPDVRARWIDLADVLAGRSEWRIDPPGMVDNLMTGVPPCPTRQTPASTKGCAT